MRQCLECGKTIPDRLDYCSLDCLNKSKYEGRTIRPPLPTVYVKTDHSFTDYAHARQRGDTKEAERLSKVIDDNTLIASAYIGEVQSAYMAEPDLPKLTLDEWLKLKGIGVTIQAAEEISLKAPRNVRGCVTH